MGRGRLDLSKQQSKHCSIRITCVNPHNSTAFFPYNSSYYRDMVTVCRIPILLEFTFLLSLYNSNLHMDELFLSPKTNGLAQITPLLRKGSDTVENRRLALMRYPRHGHRICCLTDRLSYLVSVCLYRELKLEMQRL